MIRQTIEDNQASDPPAESESLRDPIVKLDLTKRLKGGDNGKVEMTESPKQAKAPKGRAELTKAPLPLPIDPKEGEDDQILMESYTRGESSHRTPDDGSNNTHQPTKIIEASELRISAPRRSRRA